MKKKLIILTQNRAFESAHWTNVFIADLNVNAEEALREAAREYLHTDEGHERIKETFGKYNWGDFVLHVSESILSRHGISKMHISETYMVTGRIDQVFVDYDEVLVDEKHEALHEANHFKISLLYADKIYAFDGVTAEDMPDVYGYGDIYDSEEAVKKLHPDAEVMIGFGVYDTSTGILFDESPDWCWSIDDALDFIEEHLMEEAS